MIVPAYGPGWAPGGVECRRVCRCIDCDVERHHGGKEREQMAQALITNEMIEAAYQAMRKRYSFGSTPKIIREIVEEGLSAALAAAPTPPPAELRADLQAYADLSDLVQAYRAEVTALTERVSAVEVFTKFDPGPMPFPIPAGTTMHEITKRLLDIRGLPTPPQPAADDGLLRLVSEQGCHAAQLKSLITQAVERGCHWSIGDPADDADGPDLRWREVEMAWHDAEYAEDWWRGKAAVAKAVELGLVPRIDPDDMEQVRVVAKFCAPGLDDYTKEFWARRILTALASHLAAREAGTE